MSTHDELVAYIRQCRPQFSRDAIKDQLLKEGIPESAIESALRAVLEPPVEPGLPAAHSTRWGLWLGAALPATLLGLGAVFLVAKPDASKPLDRPKLDNIKAAINAELVLSRARASREGKRDLESSSIQAALDSYRPPLYADPDLITPNLPSGLSQGDAFEDYRIAAESLFRQRGRELRKALKAVPLDEQRFAAAIQAVDRGTLKSAYQLRSRPEPRNSQEYLDAVEAMNYLIMLAGAAHRQRYQRLRDQGQLDLAEQEARKLLAFSYHLMQDWLYVTQASALITATLACLELSNIRARRGPRSAEERLLLAKLPLQLRAHAAQPEELLKIEELAGEPATLAQLRRYLDEPSLRRPYCQTSLLMASAHWSRAEILAAAPAAERRALFDCAMLHADERVAAMGRLFNSFLQETEEKLRSMTPSQREIVKGRKLLRGAY